MNTGKISTRYALALYSLSKEQGVEEEVYVQMYALGEAMIAFPKLQQALSSPMFSVKDKMALLKTASGGNPCALLEQFFNFVLSKRRESFILFMSMSYQDLYRKDKDIVVAKVTTAVDLQENTLEKVKSLVTRLSKSKDVLLRTEVKKDIIGGYVLELNNYRIDASVKTKLNEIEKHLTAE